MQFFFLWQLDNSMFQFWAVYTCTSDPFNHHFKIATLYGLIMSLCQDYHSIPKLEAVHYTCMYNVCHTNMLTAGHFFTLLCRRF